MAAIKGHDCIVRCEHVQANSEQVILAMPKLPVLLNPLVATCSALVKLVHEGQATCVCPKLSASCCLWASSSTRLCEISHLSWLEKADSSGVGGMVEDMKNA